MSVFEKIYLVIAAMAFAYGLDQRFDKVENKLDAIASKLPVQITVTNVTNNIENHPYYCAPRMDPYNWSYTNGIPIYVGPVITLTTSPHMDPVPLENSKQPSR